MKIFYKILILLLVIGMTNCQDKFLELDPLDEVTEASYFETPEHFEAAANNFYNQLIGFKGVSASGVDGNTQYADVLDFGTDLTGYPQEEGQGSNTLAITDVYWSNWYFWLRDVNVLLEKSEEYDGEITDLDQSIGTAYFFRALHHFLLVQRFGGVPIATTVYDLDSPELYGARNSRYEVIAQVLSDLDLAIDLLPIEQNISDADKGKISSWGAMALKARVLLYEASWEKYVGTETDGDGVSVGAGSAKPDGYPSTTEMYTEAIEMSTNVMDNGGYSLWNYNNDALMENFSSYYLFNIDGDASNPLGLTKSSNNEFIIQGVYDATTRTLGANVGHTVQDRLRPSRKFLDMFLCTDGLPTDRSPLFLGYNTVWDEIQNRDNRLTSYFIGVPDNSSPVLASPDVTGINCRKFRGYDYGVYRPANSEGMNFPYLRLAEVYLIYAEALYEANGAITDEELASSINMIRERAGLPALTNAFVTANGLDMLDEIRRERTVELYAENSRYNDLKRWGIAVEALATDLLGPVIEGTIYETDTTLYKPGNFTNGTAEVAIGFELLDVLILDPVSNRVFSQKNYLRPIPQQEIVQSAASGGTLLQNPGW